MTNKYYSDQLKPSTSYISYVPLATPPRGQALDKSRKSALSPAEFAQGLSSLVIEGGIDLLSGAIGRIKLADIT